MAVKWHGNDNSGSINDFFIGCALLGLLVCPFGFWVCFFIEFLGFVVLDSVAILIMDLDFVFSGFPWNFLCFLL